MIHSASNNCASHISSQASDSVPDPIIEKKRVHFCPSDSDLNEKYPVVDRHTFFMAGSTAPTMEVPSSWTSFRRSISAAPYWLNLRTFSEEQRLDAAKSLARWSQYSGVLDVHNITAETLIEKGIWMRHKWLKRSQLNLLAEGLEWSIAERTVLGTQDCEKNFQCTLGP